MSYKIVISEKDGFWHGIILSKTTGKTILEVYGKDSEDSLTKELQKKCPGRVSEELFPRELPKRGSKK